MKQDEGSEYKQKVSCPIHPKSRTHELKDCKEFFKRSFDDKKGLLNEHRACFRCCSLEHLRTDCKTPLKCSECNSTSHMTAMHMSKTPLGTEPVSVLMSSQSAPNVQLSAENPSRDASVPRLWLSTSTKLEILRGQLKFMPCLMSTATGRLSVLKC